MLDSPFEYCRICRDYVLLDQTHAECVREHGCVEPLPCPLRAFFTGIEFGGPTRKARADTGRHRD
jgi:hypothetical protein